ncbi:hypothetical protein EA473_07100 [Natrarchaeobius chitinivorans]|uniref:Uncharacterized protein n=1 Tax=Natrarchaeobius chitinivorans TaxID=1679083 RepID=A0A3N6NBD0_NATCH|nr:hypothetical protein EA473_07100 [Natrarchaeobius chitinivorans]
MGFEAQHRTDSSGRFEQRNEDRVRTELRLINTQSRQYGGPTTTHPDTRTASSAFRPFGDGLR